MTNTIVTIIIIIIIIATVFFFQIYDIFLMEWIFSTEIKCLFFLIKRNNINSALPE